MGYSKEKQEILMSSLTTIGSLAGDNRQGFADGSFDLGLEQAKCEEQAKAVRDGLFKVVVMGTFTSGKSTLINALIGSRVLPEAAMPTTAILTFIQYGTNENIAEVYMADELLADGTLKKGECIKMSIKDFQSTYKYTIQDEREFNETNKVERFAKVKYAIIYCSKPLMAGGVTIIDSPGLEDKAIATELALNIANEAQAIIYISSEKGLASADKAYIQDTFHDSPNNVFFVLNKIDRIPKPERKDAIEKLKADVATVFTTDSVYNEDLAKNRIFGVSALRALDSITGETFDIEDDEYRTLSESDRQKYWERSCFEPFEKALEKFLTTDDRCIAQYRKCFAQMASTYKASEEQADDFIRVFENNIQLDDARKQECEILINDIRSSINLTKTTFDNCSLKIQNSVRDLLTSCVNDIDRTWDNDMEEIASRLDIGTFQYMKLGLGQINPLSSKETKEAKMKEFCGNFIDVVSEYFAEKIDRYINDNFSTVDKVVEECQKTLNTSLETTNQLFEELGRTMVGSPTQLTNPTDSSWLQVLISAWLGDYSAVVKTGAEGKAPWLSYLKRTIFNTVWQFVLISMLDGGIGLLLALVIEYVQGKHNCSETVHNLLDRTKDSILQAIRIQSSETVKKINKDIAAKMDESRDTKCSDAYKELNDKENLLKKIEASRQDETFNLAQEKTRCGNILTEMFNEARKAYLTVFEKELQLEQFKSF